MTVAIPVILNVRSGTSAPIDTARLRHAFHVAGLDVQLYEAKTGDEIVALTLNAIASAPPMIVAGGGDGTVSAVAAELVDRDIPLGVLPLGTLNHFARDLRIPAEVESAVRLLATGQPVRVDVGEVNGRVFLNNSSIGLYTRLVRHRDHLVHRLGRNKWTALLRAAWTVLRRYPQLSVRVRVGGEDLVRRTPLVFVGNNMYAMEGLQIGRRVRVDAGTLSLYIPRRQGRSALFRIALRAVFGRLNAVRDFDSLAGAEILVETQRSFVRIAIDGEVTGSETPLRYRIRPGALRVIAPPVAGQQEDLH